MTQEQFDKLPGLLTRAQFMVVTGLTELKLRAEVEAGLVTRWKPSKPTRASYKKAYHRYYKHEAAKIGGFKMR
ncbi:MAG: hypothetical protein IPK15_24185 [Verrucomicrobia bacterium]|nr:hypothetical protein [Verrucomicrobiota bacterium]